MHRTKMPYYDLVKEAETLTLTLRTTHANNLGPQFNPTPSGFSRSTPSNRFVTKPVLQSTGQGRQQTHNPFVPHQTCLFCNDLHVSDKCPKFTTLSRRIQRLNELERCTKCVRPGHTNPQCRVRISCSLCSREHSYLVCPTRSMNRSTMVINDSKIPPGTLETNTLDTTLSQVSSKNLNSPVLLKCVSCLVTNPQYPKDTVKALVLLDDGSTTSYISSKLVTQLKLKPTSTESLSINVFNDPHPKPIKTDIVSFHFILASGIKFEMTARSIPFLSQSVPHALLDGTTLPPSYQPLNYTFGSPDILIGGDFYYDLNLTLKETLPNGFSVFNCLLGNLLAGKGSGCQTSAASTNFVVSNSTYKHTESLSPEVQLNQFFELENIGISDPLTKELPITLVEFQKSIKFNQRRYQVPLPWKEFPPNLSDNYGLSLGRLRSCLRFLNSKPEILRKYDQIIQDQLEQKIIETAPFKSSNLHYIPHQPVLNKDKLRIVYDASAKIKNSKSLNDCLNPGPLLLTNLTGVLLRFRLHTTVILCDIEKAFLQVAIDEEDRDFCRFLWIRNLDKPVEPDNLIFYRFVGSHLVSLVPLSYWEQQLIII